MENPRQLLDSSKLPGKLYFFFVVCFCFPSFTIVHLSWASFNPHLEWITNMLLSLYVYVFYWWVEVFPYHKANAFTVAKKLLENVFPLHTK